MSEEKITLQKDEIQTGNIKVATQILNDLSSGIYSSPANCIKELVNNSFDAEANLVTIRVKPIQDTITVIDDGEGMNALEFDANFAWISKSNKRNRGLYSKSGRPLIGKIGIGFIAVNEICNELRITSSKKNEDIKFTATINFKDYFNKNIKVDGGIIKAAYQLINEDEDPDTQYTIVELIDLKEGIRTILNDKLYQAKLARGKNKDFDALPFTSMLELLRFHEKKRLRSFGEDNAYIQFLIELASYLPVEYIDGGPIEGINNEILKTLFNRHKNFNFKVDLDGIYLKKPIYFSVKKNLQRKCYSFNKKIPVNKKYINMIGYFYVQKKLLIPRELNGVSIRIKNIPIAPRFGYDSTFLEYPNYMDQIFRNWVSAEIYIDKGLEEAMNIDRKSFRQSHPSFLALQDFVHKTLREEIFGKISLDLYKSGRVKREKRKTNERTNLIKTVLGVSKIKINYVDELTSPNDDFPLLLRKLTSREAIFEIKESFRDKFRKPEWDKLEQIFLIIAYAFHKGSKSVKQLKSVLRDKLVELIDSEE